MLKLTRFFVSIAAICLPALLTATVHAADISVNSNCELADAISAANSDMATGGCPAGSGGDTITLTGDVTLTAALPEIESEITIEGNGYTISGDERHQIFWVEESGALSIQNATLADGRGVDDDDLFDEDLLIGGAIVNWGLLNVRGSTYSGNSADWGGAILNFGEAYIVGSNLIGNSAKLGGAIYSESGTNTSIVNSTFTNNTADFVGGGGAAYNLGDMNVSGTAFIDNSAFWNGGAIHSHGEASISDSSFTGNSASNGGAIYSQSDTSISDSSFTSNSASYNGGAIFSEKGKANVSRSIFTGNSAIGQAGGAIYNNSIISITFSAFTDNSANSSGAISNFKKADVSNSNFTNNIAVKGGAFGNWGEASISDTNFMSNSAEEDGGAIYDNDATSISNCLFAGNSAGDEGGAIRNTEDSEVDVSQSIFRDNEAEDGGAIYSWGELNVSRSTFTNNSAIEEGGGIANHGQASINDSVLADNPGGDCHLGRKGELLESGNNHISDGSCRATWSGSVTEGYCPPGQERDGECQIGATDLASASQ